MKKSDFVLTLGKRLFLLLCLFLICYLLTTAVSYLVINLLPHNMPAALRIGALAQDVIAFIIPAVATAVIICRRPAELLCITRKPSAMSLILLTLTLIVSIPFQEWIIDWNNNISFPQSLADLEQTLRALETQAFETMKILLANPSPAALVLNILVIGVGAAFAEEILFRGCFQRLLTTGGVNAHLAIWLVAFCFSAMHMEFFGLVPRMLLGAFFGYLLLWTGSLWTPITAHFLNNTAYVVTAWLQVRAAGPDAITEEPSSWPWWATLISLALTALAILTLKKEKE